MVLAMDGGEAANIITSLGKESPASVLVSNHR